MDLLDLFFPDQAQAAHLREIAAHTKALSVNEIRGRKRDEAAAEDLAFLALVLLGLIESLVAKNLVTREELTAQLRGLGALDATQDSRARLQVLRHALGLPPAAEPRPRKPVRIVRAKRK